VVAARPEDHRYSANEEETAAVRAEEMEVSCARRSRRGKRDGAMGEEEWLEKGKEREIPGKRKERSAEGGICSLR
jgi:hypothetical protein